MSSKEIVSGDEFEKEVQHKSLIKYYSSVLKAVASGMGGTGFEIVISEKREVGVNLAKKTITVPNPENASYHQLSLVRGIIDHELAFIRYKGRQFDSVPNPLLKFIRESVEDFYVDGSACEEYAGCKTNIQELYYSANSKLFDADEFPKEVLDLQKLLLVLYADSIDTFSYMPAQNMFVDLYDKYKDRIIRTQEQADRLATELFEDVKDLIEESKLTKTDTKKYSEKLGDEDKSLKDMFEKALEASEKEASKSKDPTKSKFTWSKPSYFEEKDVKVEPKPHVEAFNKIVKAAAKSLNKMEAAKEEVQAVKGRFANTYIPGEILAAKDAAGKYADFSKAIYKPATHKDMIITPKPLANYANIEKIIRDTKQHYGELYSRMVRVYKQLLPAPKRMQPKGSLECSRVYRAVVLDDQDVFIRKQRVNKFDVSFQLLVDLSGSMDGEKVRSAVESVILFSQVLNSLGIPFEITGFTAMGSAMDGAHNWDTGHNRFCPLRNYIFKPFNERLSWQLFGRLEGIFTGGIPLIENVDGESVDWAAKRLVQQRTKKKILMVFSDGQPASGDPYALLNRHLKETVTKWSSSISIIGIGIQTDSVKEFYPKYAVINKLDDLAKKVISVIEDELKAELKNG